jgi:hypothetical protein
MPPCAAASTGVSLAHSNEAKPCMDFSQKPWNARVEEIPPEIFTPYGMIGPEERRCYYWLARHGLSGAGCVIDAGSFLGASTLCFAAGAAAGGHESFRGGPVVHAYDHFKAYDAYIAEAIRKHVRPIKKGESYLDIFKTFTVKYRALIEAHPGNIFEQRWGGDPIELLFIDVAKRARLNAHVSGEFFPHLMPGRSIVIHQDYFHCWHPYIHVGMEYLADSFELIDELVLFQSRVWRLVKPLPAEKVARLRDDDFSGEERIALLDRLVERSSARCRPMMEVVRAWQRCLDEDYAAAKADLARLRRDYGVEGRHELWAKQIPEIEQRCKDQFAALGD